MLSVDTITFDSLINILQNGYDETTLKEMLLKAQKQKVYNEQGTF